MNSKEYLTPGAAADALNIHRETLRRYEDAGYFEAIRTSGGHRRYLKEEVNRYAEEGLPALTSEVISRYDETNSDVATGKIDNEAIKRYYKETEEESAAASEAAENKIKELGIDFDPDLLIEKKAYPERANSGYPNHLYEYKTERGRLRVSSHLAHLDMGDAYYAWAEYKSRYYGIKSSSIENPGNLIDSMNEVATKRSWESDFSWASLSFLFSGAMCSLFFGLWLILLVSLIVSVTIFCIGWKVKSSQKKRCQEFLDTKSSSKRVI